MQRLRIRYAKRGRLRFTSHRDFSRAFERAVFRARVPMAYSSGFNPHPRISYAGAAPTGSASEAEYLEIGLAEVVDPADVHAAARRGAARRARRPRGRRVAAGGSLADLLEASRWRIDARRAGSTRRAAGGRRVPRRGGGGGRADDQEGAARASTAARRSSRWRADAVRRRGARLDLVLRHAVPVVRPDDVLTGLARLGGLDAGPAPAADPAGPGSARRGDRRGRRPAAELDGARASATWCAILGHGRPLRRHDSDDPTTFSPGRILGPARWSPGRRQTATRPGGR